MSSNPVITSDQNPDNDPVVHGLTKRRAELVGYIDHLEDCIAKAKNDLVYLDGVLSMWGFDNPALKIRARAATTAGIFHRKELPRRLMELLRDNPAGMTTAQLAERISKDKGWDYQDKRFQVALVDKIGRVTSKIRSQGRIVSERTDDGVLWKKIG